MKKSRTAQRDELGESILEVLVEFEEWYLPATVGEIGNEFMMFLKWLEDNGYVIVPIAVALPTSED